MIADLSIEELKTGLDALLERVDVWPPGPLEFRHLCQGRVVDKRGNDITHQHQGAAYKMFKDPNHPTNNPDSVEYVKKQPIGIEQEGYVSKRKKAGKKAISDMRGMFS